MTDDKRRARRITDDLPVKLTLREGIKGSVVAGPIEGLISNISSIGLGFTVPHVHFGEFHLVYSAQDTDTPHTLFAEISPPGAPEKAVSLPVVPVWFDSIFMSGSMSFRIGVEFLEPPDEEQQKEFERIVSEATGHPAGWWANLLQKFQPQNPQDE